jgi:hypothetical protein
MRRAVLLLGAFCWRQILLSPITASADADRPNERLCRALALPLIAAAPVKSADHAHPASSRQSGSRKRTRPEQKQQEKGEHEFSFLVI